MLNRRLRRRPRINPALVQCARFAEMAVVRLPHVHNSVNYINANKQVKGFLRDPDPEATNTMESQHTRDVDPMLC